MDPDATMTKLPEDLTSNGHLFRIDSCGNYIPATTSKSRTGIYCLELSDGLADRILPNGRKIREKVVNLQTTDFDKAVERAQVIIMDRKEMSVRKVGKILNSADLITESVKNADPNGGNARRVWERYSASEPFKKKAELSKKNARSTFGLLERHVGEKSLYDFGVDDASAFVMELLKDHAVRSVRNVYLPVYREIWNTAMPLIKNPWYDCAKWDEMRKMLSVSGHGAEVTPDMSLSAFSEEYFRREAASGRKWERNTEGFMRHFINNMGVKKVRDVTQNVAMEYARKMVEDPKAHVNRRGRDRISKFHTMWAMLLPDHANPWDNVCYDVAVREFPKAEEEAPKEEQKEQPSEDKRNDCPGMPEVGFASSSDCYRCIFPARLWDEYAKRHPMNPKRETTAKSMFMRLWEKTGFTSPRQITFAVAENYAKEVWESKKSGFDDLIVLRMVWDVLMPGVQNPWPTKISRRNGLTFNERRRKYSHENFCRRKEEAEQPELPDDGEPLPEAQQSVAENATGEKAQEHSEPMPAESSAGEEPTPEVEDESSGKISFDEMYGIWESKTHGMYKSATYSGYKCKLMRFAGWMLGRGVTKVGPGDVGSDTARAYYEWIGRKIQYPINDVSVLGIMWAAAFPKDRARNPWKALYDEIAVPQEPKIEKSWASRLWSWFAGLFRR